MKPGAIQTVQPRGRVRWTGRSLANPFANDTTTTKSPANGEGFLCVGGASLTQSTRAPWGAVLVAA